MICKLFQQQGAPEVEADKFSGNPLEYQYFPAIFRGDSRNKIQRSTLKVDTPDKVH